MPVVPERSFVERRADAQLRTALVAAPSDHGPHPQTVTLPDGRRLQVLCWAGEGVPVVYLHGLLDSAEGWAPLCSVSPRAGFAFDLGGFGGSDLPLRPSFAGYAEDLIAALDVLVPGDFVIVGHSLGGGIATALAERLPGRVRALILLAPAGYGRIPLAEAISIPGVREVAHRLLPFGLGSRTAVATAYRMMVANGMEPDDALIARVVDNGGRLVVGAREATKAVVRGGLSATAFHRRRLEYGGPVVVVWGDRDRLVPIAHLAGVAVAFPEVDAQVWRGMGHHPQRERPARLATLLDTTCTRVERGRPRPRAA